MGGVPVPVVPDPATAEYRKDLIALEQRAQEEYDNTLLTLSGGALGQPTVLGYSWSPGSAGCPVSPPS
jgi:hypothetical protein